MTRKQADNSVIVTIGRLTREDMDAIRNSHLYKKRKALMMAAENQSQQETGGDNADSKSN